MKKLTITILTVFLFTFSLISQNIGVKTNFAHWAAAGTPNAGLEFALNRKYTLEVGGGFNPFTFKDNNKAKHWIVQPELRYWLCESFNGHFFGLHALAGEYNIGGIDIPVGRLSKFKDYRYEGFAYGAGLSYGYQWVLGKRWNFEFNLGAGYTYLTYDKYPCVKCGSKLGSGTNNYFGVTKAAVSLIYLIK
ncbi:DUF3575 domain-containing protein [Petrimonas sp.]|uniref:DUF3575 domain-containing protein n=1 Tax=Petrimonas sp. TaxID=2023866 RepID=UPI003F5120C5